MKRIILLALLVVTGTMVIWSQAPQAMNYKAIAKDDWGVALPSKTITLRFTILQGSKTGSIVYQETHTTTTNKFGLMDVEIGKGTPAVSSFDLIDWSTGVYYIQIEMDPKGGSDFRLEDPAHQLLSVPYALYAETSGSSNFSETDPFFTSSPSSSIMTGDIYNWNAAYSWGNHANEGYLKGFTESDPIFLLHPAHGIASDNISNWSTAFSWGNHAGLYRPISYVPAWSEIIDKPSFATVAISGNYTDLNNKPSTDGSETKVIAGTNVTIEGTGTEVSPYIINSIGGSGNSTLSQILGNGNSADGKNIKNLASPVDDSDAATKAYVDELLQRIVILEGIVGVGENFVRDIDGNIYNTVEIGTQTWLKQNLKVTHYRNGDAILNANALGDNYWGLLTDGAFCDDYPPPYVPSEGYSPTYGRLYNFYAVEDSRNLCPAGWHVPTDAEWTILVDYLGGESVAGGKLKEVGTIHWLVPNPGATNESGFTALPGGARSPDGSYGSLYDGGFYWSSTAYSSTFAWCRVLTINGVDAIYRNSTYKRNGMSVRCLKD